MRRSTFVRGIAAALVTSPQWSIAQAQAPSSDWPKKEINLVVGFSAGGVTDIIARAFARRLEGELKVPVIVLNKPGAQGTLGPDTVRKAPGDGYQLAMVGTSALALSPYLANNPYKPTDFDYIGGIGFFRLGIVVRADSPYKQLSDLIAAAKVQPKFFGTSSGSVTMGFDGIAKASGAKLEAVNYKSGPEIVSALIGGQIEAAMQTAPEILPHVQSGRLRLLAIASPVRWQGYAVPTLQDIGIATQVESWLGIGAPKNLSPVAADKLRWAFGRIAAQEGFLSELSVNGMDGRPLPAAEFGEKMQATFVEAAPVMRSIASASK